MKLVSEKEADALLAAKRATFECPQSESGLIEFGHAVANFVLLPFRSVWNLSILVVAVSLTVAWIVFIFGSVVGIILLLIFMPQGFLLPMVLCELMIPLWPERESSSAETPMLGNPSHAELKPMRYEFERGERREVVLPFALYQTGDVLTIADVRKSHAVVNGRSYDIALLKERTCRSTEVPKESR